MSSAQFRNGSPVRRLLMGGDSMLIKLLAVAAVGAVVAGREAAQGSGLFTAVALAGAAFAAWTVSRPQHAALGVLAVLPFMVYPAGVGGLSVFVGLPAVVLVSLALLLSQHGSRERLRWRLSIGAFGVLLLAASAAAAHSTSLSTAGSRVLYLVVFALFGWALAAAITSGSLTTRAVAQAIVAGAALAAVALIVQVVAQFASGQQSVLNWLAGELRLFAGQRTAQIATPTENWVVGSLNIVRGVFPFMAAPSAGQYMMLGLVSAVWLARQRVRAAPHVRALERLAVLLIGAALLLTFSRQAWLGALVGIGALTLRRNLLKPVMVGALLFALLVVTPVPGAHSSFGDYLLTASDTTSTSSATRLGLLSQAVHLVPGHSLVGVGPGLYGTLNPDPSKPIYYAHNVWLDESVELGVVGGLALIALFLLAMRSAFRRRATLGFALLAAFVVANLFDDVLYFPRNGFLLAAAFALAAADGREVTATPADTHLETRSA
jgi:O-antigen ligase